MDLAKKLIGWYDKEGREGLPWREDPQPYHVWISEIMLQQTRVDTVMEYYRRFLEALPDVQALAESDEDMLLKLWQGLGYYSRAKNLKKAAEIIVRDREGRIPSEKKDLETLPGIGSYTAGAISSIAFQKREIAADGNAYRVAARLCQEDGFLEKRETRKRLEAFLRENLPDDRPGDFNQALMDLGSGICLPHQKPLCSSCPICEFCKAYKNSDPINYPKKKEKRTRRIEKKTVFLIQRERFTLLVRRPDQGLLAGLWALPMVDGHLSSEKIDQAIEEILGNKPLESPGRTYLGKARHIFSHIEWHMEGWAVLLKDQGEEKRKKEEALCESRYFKEKSEPYLEKLAPDQVWASRKDLCEKYSIPSAFEFYLSEEMAE